MKKTKVLGLLLVVVFSLSVMLTACGGTTESETPAPTVAPTAAPTATVAPTVAPTEAPLGDPEKVHLVECQFYGDSMENIDYKDAWPVIVEDHYGVQITMTHPARNNYMEVIQLSAMSGDLTGLVELFGGSYLMEWKAEDLIYPLSDFLEDNEVYNNVIPELWKETHTIDGDVWALPTGDDGAPSWFTRSMRGDWLDKFGLSKPYTIDEFYEASKMFTYNDPDGNGENDTTGFTTSGTWNMQDIFQAFDARLNHIADPKPIWNPNTDIWEDSMIKPEMAECLAFLNQCFTEKLLDNECFAGIGGSGMRSRVSSGMYGGTFYWDSWVLSFEAAVQKLLPDAYMVCVGALSKTITENLNHYGIGQGAPRVMMKTTAQPKETINWYINNFFGDDWGFWTGRLGPVGMVRGEADKACTIEGNVVVRNTYVDAGVPKTYPGPGFIGGLPAKALYTVYEVAYYLPVAPEGYETWAADTAQRAMDQMARRKSWIDEYVANGMAYVLPENLKEPTAPKYLEIGGDISTAGTTAIAAAVSGNMTIADALAEYKSTANSIGVIEILDFENAKIGKTTEQSYN
ncbi:MAG: extracellular solute-binding protein [Clostridia bacterium]|nr:extracellular solute-binding protein [Clostridia bacterium]